MNDDRAADSWAQAYAELEHEYHAYRTKVESRLFPPPQPLPPRIFYTDPNGQKHLVHRIVKILADHPADQDVLNVYVIRYDWIGGEVQQYGWIDGDWHPFPEGGHLPVALQISGVGMHGRTAGDDLDQILTLLNKYRGEDPCLIVEPE